MDKEVLKQQLTERYQRALDEALKAVDQAPDGQWIEGSDERFKEMKIGLFYDQPKKRRHAFVTQGNSEEFGPLLKEHAKQVAFEEVDESLSLTDGCVRR